MTLHFKIDGQTIERLDKNKIASDSAQYVLARFDVSSDWNMEKLFTPLFRVGAVSYTPELREDGKYLDENNICVVPHECLQNSGVVSVSAFLTDENKRITTAEVQFVVEKSGFADATASIEPTQDKYEKILESYADFKQSAFLKGGADLKLTDRHLQLTANGEAVGGGITLPDFDKFELWNDITLEEDIKSVTMSKTDDGIPLKIKRLFILFAGSTSGDGYITLRYNAGVIYQLWKSVTGDKGNVVFWVNSQKLKDALYLSQYPSDFLKNDATPDNISIQGLVQHNKSLGSDIYFKSNITNQSTQNTGTSWTFGGTNSGEFKLKAGSRILVWGVQDDD